MSEPVDDDDRLQLASLAERLVGIVMDVVVALSPFVALGGLGVPALPLTIGWLAATTAYGLIGWSRGGTFGHRIVKTTIVRADDGGEADAAMLVRRWAVTFGPALIPVAVVAQVWLVVLVISIAADAELRGIHDKAAGTAVIRRS